MDYKTMRMLYYYFRDKFLFYNFGIKTRTKREAEMRYGKRMQSKLNTLHGTNIEYGHYKF